VGRVLILEPQSEIRQLVGRVAGRLGHEALTEPPAPLHGIDAIVLEPESLRGLTVAQELRERSPELPIICASIAAPSAKTRALGPVAYLLKPFTLQDLERALSSALPTQSGDSD
jgi:CheY-like chemotaxis protein